MEARNDLKLLLNEFDENNNSHVFLIETTDILSCEKDLKKIIKNIVASDKITECQIDNDEFIDLIIIRPEGNFIKKDKIELLQQRLKVKPVVSKKMIYIITPAESLNDYAANKLLKTIEEPNDDVIGFLITNNISQILPTIKSRCEILNIKYDIKQKMYENSDYIEFAKELIKLIENKTLFDIHLYLKNNKECIKYSKEIANTIKDYYNNACAAKNVTNLNHELIELIRKNNSFEQIVHKAMRLNKLLNNLNINMNAELLIEKICIELKDVTS